MELGPNVTVLTQNDRTFYLVGNHFVYGRGSSPGRRTASSWAGSTTLVRRGGSRVRDRGIGESVDPQKSSY